MKRASRIVLAAALLGATSMASAQEQPAPAAGASPAPEAAPAPAPAADAPAGGGADSPPPGQPVSPDQLPGLRVQREIQEELAKRQVPDREQWRKDQRTSWHMDGHMGSNPERYHHLTDPEHTRYYKMTKAARNDYEGELGRARDLADKEIAMEDAAGKQVVFAEDGGRPTRHHAHFKSGDNGKHVHRHGTIWANEWERTHKGCIWKVNGDIEQVGSRDVPADEGHVVPPPRPVRWNDALHACPLPYDTWFRPPPEQTVVVPYPLPREGDWRAHISPGMNKVVDQTDWLRVVREGKPDCPKDELPVSKPEGD